MIKLYVKKITSGAINPATGEAWTIADVPERWREEVQNELNTNNPKEKL